MYLKPSTTSPNNNGLVSVLVCVGILIAMVINAEVRKQSPTRSIALIYPIVAAI